MVTIRPPNAGEAATQFWNLPALRTASELVLQIPRVGFFCTPAFFANWQTNTSNQMRVTTNQALIVATGSSVDGTDTTTPSGVCPGSTRPTRTQVACFTCHKILDPTRSIFSATYSWNYHDQLDPTWTEQPGVFAFRGVIQPVAQHGWISAAPLAKHPFFASAWAQKLCYYVNSAPCAPADVAAARRAVPELELLLERAGQGARDVARHHEHDADRDGGRQRRGRRRLAPRPPLRRARRAPRVRGRLRPAGAPPRRPR